MTHRIICFVSSLSLACLESHFALHGPRGWMMFPATVVNISHNTKQNVKFGDVVFLVRSWSHGGQVPCRNRTWSKRFKITANVYTRLTSNILKRLLHVRFRQGTCTPWIQLRTENTTSPNFASCYFVNENIHNNRWEHIQPRGPWSTKWLSKQAKDRDETKHNYDPIDGVSWWDITCQQN